MSGKMKRIILEMGSGNDLYGEDYTKAACRAVENAIRHSSLTLFSSLSIDHSNMLVNVTIGVQKPNEINTDLVLKKLPRGVVKVRVVKGGLNVFDPNAQLYSVIATAAVEAYIEIEPSEWVISKKPALNTL